VISTRRRSPPDSVRRRFREGCQSQLGQEFCAPGSASARVERQRLQDGHDVVFDAEPAKDGGFLRQIPNPLAGAHVHGVIGDIRAVEQDAARVGRRQADDHRERRRFASAVGAEQPDDFA
jgi:hypothetical protein